MNNTIRAMCIALLSLSFVACQADQDAPEDTAAAPAPLVAPASEDDAAWGEYLTDVVRRNIGGITNSPFLYYLPSETTEGFDGEYGRLLEKAETDIGRGILPGNMLAFGSPASSQMADLIIDAFSDVEEASMEGVRVLFIGDAPDSQRVQDALAPTGVEYVFVEAK